MTTRHALIAAACLIVFSSLLFQAWQIYRFISAGPRFTATDGAALCQRVRALEQHSYGYQHAGLQPLPCDYATRPPGP